MTRIGPNSATSLKSTSTTGIWGYDRCLRPHKSHGWSSEVLIGNLAQVGNANAKIAEEDPGRVVLHVGRAKVEFVVDSKSFKIPTIGL